VLRGQFVKRQDSRAARMSGTEDEVIPITIFMDNDHPSLAPRVELGLKKRWD
jgi:hypothetical protein